MIKTKMMLLAGIALVGFPVSAYAADLGVGHVITPLTVTGSEGHPYGEDGVVLSERLPAGSIAKGLMEAYPDLSPHDVFTNLREMGYSFDEAEQGASVASSIINSRTIGNNTIIPITIEPVDPYELPGLEPVVFGEDGPRDVTEIYVPGGPVLAEDPIDVGDTSTIGTERHVVLATGGNKIGGWVSSQPTPITPLGEDDALRAQIAKAQADEAAELHKVVEKKLADGTTIYYAE